MCIDFFRVMHNTIEDSVLFVMSGYRMKERLQELERLFNVEKGRAFKLSMRVSQSKDTLHLFRLTKRTDVNSELPSPNESPSIFALAEDKFSVQNREATYRNIKEECRGWEHARKKRKTS